jgi:hypothetical protein
MLAAWSMDPGVHGRGQLVEESLVQLQLLHYLHSTFYRYSYEEDDLRGGSVWQAPCRR